MNSTRFIAIFETAESLLSFTFLPGLLFAFKPLEEWILIMIIYLFKCLLSFDFLDLDNWCSMFSKPTTVRLLLLRRVVLACTRNC